jgi:hypothetical protein
MAFSDIPITYRLTSGRFTPQMLNAEIAGMMANPAFQNEMNQISGIIPPGPLGDGKFTQFLITDDSNVYVAETNVSRVKPDVSGEGQLSDDGTKYVIYLNPDQSFPKSDGSILTVAETLAHEFGHATDEGLNAAAQDLTNRSNGVSTADLGEPVARNFEQAFDEANIPPIFFETGGNLTPVDRPPGEPPAYLYANAQGPVESLNTNPQAPADQPSFWQSFYSAASGVVSSVWRSVDAVGNYITNTIITTPAKGESIDQAALAAAAGENAQSTALPDYAPVYLQGANGLGLNPNAFANPTNYVPPDNPGLTPAGIVSQEFQSVEGAPLPSFGLPTPDGYSAPQSSGFPAVGEGPITVYLPRTGQISSGALDSQPSANPTIPPDDPTAALTLDGVDAQGFGNGAANLPAEVPGQVYFQGSSGTPQASTACWVVGGGNPDNTPIIVADAGGADGGGGGGGRRRGRRLPCHRWLRRLLRRSGRSRLEWQWHQHHAAHIVQPILRHDR